MRQNNRLFNFKHLAIALMACQSLGFDAAAHPASCKLLSADRVFDGMEVQFNKSVLVVGDKVRAVGNYADLRGQCATRYNLGDATILPGFIESHAHITFQNVTHDKVLEHGITTAQDTGGPLLPPNGGKGALRLLSTGPILQAQGGYPLNIFSPDDTVGGFDKVGLAIAANATESEVRAIVQNLVGNGASEIKIALEVGGEAGAPWMLPHGDAPVPEAPWAVLSPEQVRWIVSEAHISGKKVLAHVGENNGFQIAYSAGVDTMAHIPCAAIDPVLLHEAVNDGMKFISTIDTLGSCGQSLYDNAHAVGHVYQAHAGDGLEFPLIYGSEIAHDNVPWGINGEELHLMLHLSSGETIEFPDVLNVLRSATSQAAAHLDTGIQGLGTLTADAPADLIAVKGNGLERFKLLEYPDLVMSGGKLVVNNFSPSRKPHH
ncbi:amidohydrolase family protein [Methylomonas methanica]|uniref:Amidohydrolase n=1 Tax=Methylomonas methanica (strain DSM 25384 / MC09) TaxID=857087 RepID=G0A2C5_METMM|nr:amidohydrolase family protein [Methylomonas methanica]AEF98937.1 amidohydrolase [Methylomonas methanica MC09]